MGLRGGSEHVRRGLSSLVRLVVARMAATDEDCMDEVYNECKRLARLSGWLGKTRGFKLGC